MQQQYRRSSSFRESDLSINYIGYYTDNGKSQILQAKYENNCFYYMYLYMHFEL